MIASGTGIQDLDNVRCSNLPLLNTMSTYASTEYDSLILDSIDDFLPVELSIPFNFLFQANEDVHNGNSFEYWFSRWVLLNFGVPFQKIQL